MSLVNGQVWNTFGYNFVYTGSAGGNQSHDHGSTVSQLSPAQSILPPYYALAFIMKL
jgi:hypothetical protein